MRIVEIVSQAFFDAAAAVSGIAKVEFISAFAPEDLDRIARTPLLLICPHMIYLTYARHRQRGVQLLMDCYLVTRNQRGERNYAAASGGMALLDALDRVVIDQNFGLQIQPFDAYRREMVKTEKSLSVVRSIYVTVIYSDLAESKFEYVDEAGKTQTVEFTMVSTTFQTEDNRDTNDYGRGLDGTMRSYTRTAKKRFDLKLTLISTTLKEQLRAMKAAKTEITYYRDKTADPTMRCHWTNDFNFFEERPGFWTGSILLHEV